MIVSYRCGCCSGGARDELLAQGEMVVDLAVEHDPQGAVFVRNGLMPARQVDDTQPSHANVQLHRPYEITFIVPALDA